MKKRPTDKSPRKAVTAAADDIRPARGRVREGARFTSSPTVADLPADYGETLARLKDLVTRTRLKTVLAANAAMVMAYWEMGRTILERQGATGWGAKVIDRLSADLRREFPDMGGLSPRNLKYMRAFAAAWPDPAIVQGPLAQITWYHNLALLEKLDDPGHRLWYARQVAERGWSQPVLCLQIERGVHLRQGRIASNFPTTLPPADSDLAAQVFKDPTHTSSIFSAPPTPGVSARSNRLWWTTSNVSCSNWERVSLSSAARFTSRSVNRIFISICCSTTCACGGTWSWN